MGSVLPFNKSRSLEIRVKGADSLDKVEVIKNNRVLKRFNFLNHSDVNTMNPLKGKVKITVSWGEKGVQQEWDVHIKVKKGDIRSSEPHFHGTDVVAPEDKHEINYRFTSVAAA